MVHYRQECGGYPDPAIPAEASICLNKATAHRCAFGVGNSCRPCPAGAICPGGHLMRAQPGYFVSSAVEGKIGECQLPMSERCRGYDPAVASLNRCGDGYTGKMCKLCVSDHYLSPSGTCEACPGKPYDDLALSAVPFMSFVLVVFVIVIVAVWKIESRLHGSASTWQAFSQAKDFSLWIVLSAQILATASSPTVCVSWICTRMHEYAHISMLAGVWHTYGAGEGL